MSSTENIHISEDPAQALASEIAALAKKNGGANLAFSGGRGCEAVCKHLATTFSADVPWDRIMFFQADELAVPRDDEASHWQILKRTILIGHPDARTFHMDVAAHDAAQDYEHVLMNMLPFDHHGTPVLDVIILELEADGHVASLFANSHAYHERHEPVARVQGTDGAPDRLTLTMPTLNAANHRWVITTDISRAQVLAECLDDKHPAGQLKGAHWFITPSIGTALESLKNG